MSLYPQAGSSLKCDDGVSGTWMQSPTCAVQKVSKVTL